MPWRNSRRNSSGIFFGSVVERRTGIAAGSFARDEWELQFTDVFRQITAFAAGHPINVVNPKVLFICAAAGLAIGSEGIGIPEAWLAVAYFVAIAASTPRLRAWRMA